MGCLKLSILDKQYKKTELKVSSRKKELTINFCDWNVRSSSFNAKELDEESGLYYYEARYHDPKAGTFNSRDPLFEKYFWMSPYAYCANNPITYIDPDGKKVVVAFQEAGSSATTKLYYKNGNLYTNKNCERGYEYSGNNQFARNVESDLNDIASKGGELNSRLNTLIDSKLTHTIKKNPVDKGSHCMPDPQGERNGEKMSSIIEYARDPNKSDKQNRSILVHELLGHGYSYDQGCRKEGTQTIGNTYLDQIWAIDIQNVYNKTVGLPLRTTTDIEGKNDVSKYLKLNLTNELKLNITNE